MLAVEVIWLEDLVKHVGSMNGVGVVGVVVAAAQRRSGGRY